MSVRTELDPDFDVPSSIADVIEKWAEALAVTMERLQAGVLGPSHAHMLFEAILETAGAVFAPGEPDMAAKQMIIALFAKRLDATCDQYMTDKAAAMGGQREY